MTDEEKRAVEQALVERIAAFVEQWGKPPRPGGARDRIAADIRREFGTPTRKVAGHKDTGAGL